MGILIDCPVAASLGAPREACSESVGQIQKGAFQRQYASAGVKNKIVVATTPPAELATWTTLLVASDATKLIVTPPLSAPEMTPGAAITYGGGNETIGGIKQLVGTEPTDVTFNFLKISQATIADLKKFKGEDIALWMFDEYGRTICLADDVITPTELYPIPLAYLFISDKKLGGKSEPDMNMAELQFFPNWSDKLVIVNHDFNPLSALINQ
jgi:hypothetical protein